MVKKNNFWTTATDNVLETMFGTIQQPGVILTPDFNNPLSGVTNIGPITSQAITLSQIYTNNGVTHVADAPVSEQNDLSETPDEFIEATSPSSVVGESISDLSGLSSQEGFKHWVVFADGQVYHSENENDMLGSGLQSPINPLDPIVYHDSRNPSKSIVRMVHSYKSDNMELPTKETDDDSLKYTAKNIPIIYINSVVLEDENIFAFSLKSHQGVPTLDLQIVDTTQKFHLNLSKSINNSVVVALCPQTEGKYRTIKLEFYVTNYDMSWFNEKLFIRGKYKNFDFIQDNIGMGRINFTKCNSERCSTLYNADEDDMDNVNYFEDESQTSIEQNEQSISREQITDPQQVAAVQEAAAQTVGTSLTSETKYNSIDEVDPSKLSENNIENQLTDDFLMYILRNLGQLTGTGSEYYAYNTFKISDIRYEFYYSMRARSSGTLAYFIEFLEKKSKSASTPAEKAMCKKYYDKVLAIIGEDAANKPAEQATTNTPTTPSQTSAEAKKEDKDNSNSNNSNNNNNSTPTGTTQKVNEPEPAVPKAENNSSTKTEYKKIISQSRNLYNRLYTLYNTWVQRRRNLAENNDTTWPKEEIDVATGALGEIIYKLGFHSTRNAQWSDEGKQKETIEKLQPIIEEAITIYNIYNK